MVHRDIVRQDTSDRCPIQHTLSNDYIACQKSTGMGIGKCFRSDQPAPRLYTQRSYLQRRMEVVSKARLTPLPKLRTGTSAFFLEDVSIWKVHIDTGTHIERIERSLERVMNLPNSVYLLKPTRIKRLTQFRLAVRMPYCRRDFFDYLMDPFDMDVLHRHLKHIAESVLWLHGQGMAHRDIKPENIVLHADGMCRLIDFDFTDTTDQFKVCGTANYAPSRALVDTWNCSADFAIRADVYSFGKMLLFCLFCAAGHRLLPKRLVKTFQTMFHSQEVKLLVTDALEEPAATWLRVAMQCCQDTPPLGIPNLSIVRPHTALVA